MNNELTDVNGGNTAGTGNPDLDFALRLLDASDDVDASGANAEKTAESVAESAGVEETAAAEVMAVAENAGDADVSEDDDADVADDSDDTDDTEDSDDSDEDDDSDDMSFADLGLDEITLAAIAKKGFVNPSPIQVLAIPRLLNGDANVIARARTGTGKTAAFGLPLVQTLREPSDCVKAIILEPTRELAMQTCTEMASFTTGRCPRTCVVYGGASMGEQIRQLKRGTDIVVGTPGRVQDLMERGVLDISKIEYFILDEGDEMLDMGFVEDIENIFAAANPDCRVLLFSATIPAPILKIAQKFMGDYEIVEEEGVVEEPLLIEQKYWIVREAEKVEALVRLIDISPDFYGLVFVQKKTDADYVSKALDEKGYEAAALHGDIPQGQREKILARFRAGKTRILVATDVAARGIDIEGLSHVVNYELPFDGPTYVHRIGRTGRAGSSGIAVTFVRPEERRRLQYLRNAIARSAKGEMIEGTIPTVDQVIEVKRARLFDNVKVKLGLKEDPVEAKVQALNEKKHKVFDNEEVVPLNENEAENSKSVEEAVAELQGEQLQSGEEQAPARLLKKGDAVFDQLAQELCEDQEPQDVVAALLALTYGRELNRNRYGKISSFASNGKGRGDRDSRRGDRGDRDRGDRGRRDRGGRSERSVFVGADQSRLYVQMGWHDGYNPKKIAGFFSNLLNIKDRDVDAIDMADKFCLLSLPAESAKRALDLSAQDSSLPHMHLDTKAGGSRGGSGNGGRSRGGRGRGDRDRGEGSENFGFGGGDRYAVGKSRDERRHSDEGRGGFKSKAKGGSNARTGVHTGTKRNSQASIYKKSSKAEEF